MIEKEEPHRIENRSKDKILKIIEVWMGEKLLEDDIERIEDDFGRV
jgi:mannose-6-phosphate isomerase-like protein (cupin superfamily)